MESREFIKEHKTGKSSRLGLASREVNRKSQSFMNLLGALFYPALTAATLYLLIRVSF
jgi:hypothetical protein